MANHSRAPNAIDISYGSLTCPSKHRHGAILCIWLFLETAPFSHLLRHAWDTEDRFSTYIPGPYGGIAGNKRVEYSMHMNVIQY